MHVCSLAKIYRQPCNQIVSHSFFISFDLTRLTIHFLYSNKTVLFNDMRVYGTPCFPKSLFYNLSFPLSSFNTNMVNCPRTIFKDVMRDSVFKDRRLTCSISVLCSSSLFPPPLICLSSWAKLIYFLSFEVLV